MGKITSIYLTDKEVAELKKFCEENQCTQYSALKTALRELTSKPIKEESPTITPQNETPQVSESAEATEKDKQSPETKSSLAQFLEKLK
jgi:hypothetical protein